MLAEMVSSAVASFYKLMLILKLRELVEIAISSCCVISLVS